MNFSNTVLPEWVGYIWLGSYLVGFLVWGIASDVVKAIVRESDDPSPLSNRLSLVTAGYVIVLGLIGSFLLPSSSACCLTVHLLLAVLAYAFTRDSIRADHEIWRLRSEQLERACKAWQQKPGLTKPLPAWGWALITGFITLLLSGLAALGYAMRDAWQWFKGLPPHRPKH
jgi:hypothetical protein